MAKKRATHKPKAKSTSKSKPKVKYKPKVKSSTSKSKGKKRGRKPSAPNRYNAIKSAISEYYQRSIGRNVKRFEMKVIYQWVKDNYGNQSLKYVVMNIDLIIDTFWKEYCNLYPVDLQNHARLFDWYYLKDYLSEEKDYHYPTDTIQVDLTSIGGGVFEFFMEDYVEKCDEYYAICTELGIRSYEYPMIFLKDAFCDISKKGNLYQYVLVLDEYASDTEAKSKPSGGGDSQGGVSGSQSGESSTTGLKTSQGGVGNVAQDSENGNIGEKRSEIDSNESKKQNDTSYKETGENSTTGLKSSDKDVVNAQIELSKQKQAETLAQKELLKQKTQTIIELKKAGFSVQEIKEIIGNL